MVRFMSAPPRHTRLPLVLATVAALLFALLTVFAVQGWTEAADVAVLQALRGATPTLAAGESTLGLALMRDVTSLGGIALVAGGAVLLLIYLGLRRSWRAMVQVLIVVGGAQLSVSLLKLIIARPRPDLVDHAARVVTYSYPSGHSTLAAAIALSLAWAGAVRHRRPSLKIYFWILGLLVLALIGFSRMVLGVHWVSDVTGGLLLGTVFACLGAWFNQPARVGTVRHPLNDSEKNKDVIA